MAPVLTLKVNDQPTWLNKEMAIGTLLFPIVGTLIGGYIGKERMERELKEGRPVSASPSFWNKDTLLGASIGYALTGLIFMATTITAVAGTAATGSPVVGGLGALAMSASLVVPTILGAYLGGKHGQNRQVAEYAEATQQTIVQGLSQTMSPEIAQAVEYRMTHDKQWGKQMLEEKLLQAAQENVRQ